MFVTGILVAGLVASPVTVWIDRNAAPVDALAGVVRGAVVVGLGESAHGVREETRLKYQTVRRLVERYGFRTIAWEEDWTTGQQVDAYIHGRGRDAKAVVRKMTTTWQTTEVVEVLRWLRGYNDSHRDKVSFVGVEFYATGHAAYDAVEAYVAAHAPDRLAEAMRHLKAIKPPTTDIGAWFKEYYAMPDKKPYIRHARALYDLVAGIRGRGHDLALHDAKQIRSFYEYAARRDLWAYRDARAAENLRWWQRRSGDRVAYWAAIPHTANAPRQRIAQGDSPPLSFPAAGSYLRSWYGKRYVSIGFTFTRGRVASGKVPPPPDDWTDAPLGAARRDPLLLDLRGAPKSWAQAPARIRVLASYDPADPDGFYLTGGSLAQWFDAIVHTETITPATPLR